MLKGIATPIRADHPGYVSGRRYGPPAYVALNNSAALAANTLYAQSLPILFPVTITGLCLRIATSVAAVKGKLTLYNPSGAKVAEGATDMDMGAAAGEAVNPFAAPVMLPPGCYMATFCSDGAAVPTTWNVVTHGGGFSFYTGAANINGLTTLGTPSVKLTAALTYVAASGFFPSTLPALTLGTATPGGPYIAFIVA